MASLTDGNGRGIAGCRACLPLVLGYTSILLASTGGPGSLSKPATPSTTSTKGITAADLAHGREEVRRLVKDRPVLGQHVQEGDAVWEWAVRRFAGEGLCRRVCWDPNLPSGCRHYYHCLPKEDKPALIQVRGSYIEEPNIGEPMTFTDAWGFVVSALEELPEIRAYEKIHEDASSGKTTREAFIRESSRVDYRVIDRTERFHATVWTPCLRAKGLDVIPFRSLGIYEATYDLWIEQFDREKSWYPWGAWGLEYDLEIQPRLIREGRFALSKSDLDFGIEQVRTMFVDRPMMAKNVKEGDELWTWTVRQFAGAGVGSHVKWRPKAPSLGEVSNCDIPFGNRTGVVRVCWCYRNGPKEGQSLSYDHAWGHLVYQMNRLSHTSEFTRAYLDALAEPYSRQKHIDVNTRIDYKAVRETKAFYDTVWKRWTGAVGVPPGEFVVLKDYREPYEAWIAQFDTFRPGFPGHAWNTDYNRNILPTLLRTKRIDPNSPDVLRDEALAKSPLGLRNSDLVHGEKQVQAMLNDRPVLAKHVEKGDAIWTWTSRRFAGEGIGTRVKWRSMQPSNDLDSSRSGPFEEGDVQIRLNPGYATGPNKGKTMSFEDAWGHVIFQLQAISLSEKYVQNQGWASPGTVKKEQFVERNLRVDHEALKLTEEFYRTVWKPWAEAKGLDVKPFGVLSSFRPEYAAWVAQLRPGAPDDLREHWRAQYDQQMKKLLPTAPAAAEFSPWSYIPVSVGILILFIFIMAEVRARYQYASSLGAVSERP